MPVWQLKYILPYSEFIEQVAYHRQFPWGDDWAQAGTMAYASAAPHCLRQQLTPQTFMPKPPRPPQSPEYILSFFKGMAEAQQQAKAARNGQ